MKTPSNDPLVVKMKIAILKVRKIFINTRSLTDIISADYYLSRLKFDENNLVPVQHPFIEFEGGVIHPMGIITLPVQVRAKDLTNFVHQVSCHQRFNNPQLVTMERV